MSSFLPNIFSAVLGDAASLAGLPMQAVAGALGGEILDRLLKTRRERATEIMLEALKRGTTRVHPDDLEESVSVLYRYLRAAEEGAARRNLRLLADVFAGQVRGKAVAADEFLYYADILTSLRREEILFLGCLHRVWVEQCLSSDDTSTRRGGTLAALRAELIPAVFSDNAEYAAVVASVSRTGLVSRFSGYGGEFYEPSPLLMHLANMVNFEAVDDGNSASKSPC